MTTAAMGVPAEVLAERLLRRAWDSAVKPDLNAIADECAMTRREVEAIRDRLLNVRTLDRSRVAPAPSLPGRNADPRPVETPPAWRAAADHPNARVRRAVAKAVAAVDVVEQLLAAEAGKDELRKKEARLAAQLAAVRAEIRGKAPAKATLGESSEKVPCPECGDLVNPHRLPQHRNRSAKHQGGDQ